MGQKILDMGAGASGYGIAYRKKEQNLIRLRCALLKLLGKQNITEVTVCRRTGENRAKKQPCDRKWSQGGFLVYDYSK